MGVQERRTVPNSPHLAEGEVCRHSGQKRMCKESCGLSGKDLQVSLAADMTMQNHRHVK